MDLILVLVFFLSLMFLAMIFGERLSLFGFVDGRWLTAPFEMMARFRDMLCEISDRLWCFVFDHFWWVAATASGGIGILIVAIIMVSGLSNEAAAVRMDEQTLMRVGGVLDHTPVIDADNVLLTNAVASKNEVSQLIYQVPSGFRYQLPASDQRPVVIDRTPLPRIMDTPLPPYREPNFNRSRLTLTMEPINDVLEVFEQQGQPAPRLDLDRLIQRAMRTLRSDDWRAFSDAQSLARVRSSRPAMREDSEFALQNLMNQVRVIPGDMVTSNSLHVEKFAPTDPGPGDFEIRIRVTNRGRDRLSGVVVRELLPVAWVAKTMNPRGVFRDTNATWLLNDLDPLQDQEFTLQVASTESGRFQSLTEVSATAAVTTNARITRRTRPLPPVQLPDVRLTLEEPLRTADVGEWTTVFFRIANIGSAPAEGVSLRVTLPAGLDHHTLNSNDINRRVDSNVRRLEAGESRRVELKVRPTIRGLHFTTAELLLQESQLDVRTFEIQARDSLSRQPLARPVPDVSNRTR
ncbi:MAG: hypothetical protein R3C59_03290 [Planctomycetaceae bacterium]